MRRLVLNRTTPASTLETIFEKNRRETHAHGIWVGLSIHPKTPEPLREAIFPHLFWRDILKVLNTPAVPERAKQKAAHYLRQKMARAAKGEWKAFARICPTRLFPWVIKQGQRELFTILLENPKMTESALIRIIHSPDMTPTFARQIVNHRLWQNRRSIRTALIYCKHSDPAIARICMEGMTMPELKEVMKTASLQPEIRVAAKALIRKKDEKE